LVDEEEAKRLDYEVEAKGVANEAKAQRKEEDMLKI